MKAAIPLLTTLVTALEEDGLLAVQMGGTTYAYALEVPPTQAYPYITVNLISMVDWSAADFDGDDILFRVAAHFERGKAGSVNGLDDVGKAVERIRDVIGNREGFDLAESPAEGESLRMDFLTGPMQLEKATNKRLLMCRYQSSIFIPGLNDDVEAVRLPRRPSSLSGVVTFRALVSPSN